MGRLNGFDGGLDWIRPSCIRSSEALRAAGLEAEKRGDVHVDGRRQGQASRGTSEANFKSVNVKLSNVSTLFQTTNDSLSVLKSIQIKLYRVIFGDGSITLSRSVKMDPPHPAGEMPSRIWLRAASRPRWAVRATRAAAGGRGRLADERAAW